MTTPATIRFSADHLEAFLAFSRDRSPLHDDAVYASRTPYGEVVVPGMCGVVSALAHANVGNWSRIRGVFKSPIFLNRDYQLGVTRSGDEMTLLISRGATPIAEIVVMKDRDVAVDADEIDPVVHDERATAYEPDHVAFDALCRHAGITGEQVPLERLSALGWASYFVGMVYPGRQAAFLSFDLSFSDAAARSGRLSFERVTATLDDRFNRVTVRGRGDVLTSITLQAVVRPERVTYSVSDIANAAADHTWWRGRSVIVTGGSRGLGAVLTRALLLAGSKVMFTYFRGADDARAIEADAKELGAVAIPCHVDLTSPSAASVLASSAAALGGVDAVISNATLPIRSEPFADQTSADFIDHVSRSLAMTEVLFRATLPLMKPSGWIVAISSTYAGSPRAGFSHYVTAKAAIEGLTRALAVEHAALRFCIARPGRMRTDQTNAPIVLERSMPATAAAAALLTRLASPELATGVVHQIELSEP